MNLSPIVFGLPCALLLVIASGEQASAAAKTVHSGSGGYSGYTGPATNYGSSFAGNYGNSGQSMDVNWPSNIIDLSQLQAIFTQNPAFKQFNILFPNQTNWNVTPSSIQSLMGNYQQEAQSVGMSDRPPGLSFSSLANAGGVKAGILQLAIAQLKDGNLLSNPGTMKNMMSDMLRQARFQNMPLGDLLPDWLKRIMLEVYDAVYSAFEFLGARLAAIFTHR